MSTPINLNKARKARAKVARRTQADENSVRFGRSKAEIERNKARTIKDTRDLDGHKQEP